MLSLLELVEREILLLGEHRRKVSHWKGMILTMCLSTIQAHVGMGTVVLVMSRSIVTHQLLRWWEICVSLGIRIHILSMKMAK